MSTFGDIDTVTQIQMLHAEELKAQKEKYEKELKELDTSLREQYRILYKNYMDGKIWMER